MKKSTFSIIIALVMIPVILLAFFICIEYISIFEKYDKNDTVVLSEDMSEMKITAMQNSIDEYISGQIKENKQGTFFYHGAAENPACAYKIIGVDSTRIYIWIYYHRNSMPIVLKYSSADSYILITGHIHGRDGRFYRKDIITLYPQVIIDNFPTAEEKADLIEHSRFG